MFYLSGRGVAGIAKRENEDEFGWYLGDHERIEDRIYNHSKKIAPSPELNYVNGTKSPVRESSSLSSTNSFTDSEDPESYAAAKDFTKLENVDNYSETIEHIEMKSFKRGDDLELELEMIEKDTDRVFNSTAIRSTRDWNDSFKVDNDSEEEEEEISRTVCYTPERLVRCQEYRILTHSPKFFAIPRSTPNGIDDTSPRRYRGHRRRLGDLIDSKQFGGSHFEVLLDSAASEVRLPINNRQRLNFRDRVSTKKNTDEDIKVGSQEELAVENRDSPVDFQSSDLVNNRLSYERLNSSWEKTNKIIRPPSQDTSGIHSNDWSTDTTSDNYTPICLCDELASASRSFSNVTDSRGYENDSRCLNQRAAAMNEVVSILEDLERDPDRAAILLEEDRFCESTSGHDHLTRLALSIEPDGAVPSVASDTHNLLMELRDKVERIQETNKDIFKDLDCLRADFKYNENKVDDLIDGTVELRQNVKEMRYLDDLLNLLDGELERISRRNWPFIFGHSDNRADDMNLVV